MYIHRDNIWQCIQKSKRVVVFTEIQTVVKNLFNVYPHTHTGYLGPIVWYQQFEYAIGHWLQKATEHVFGCVLCAPGCFSLFRGSALMDDNVARMYATKSTEAGHYVQFDQGNLFNDTIYLHKM